MIYNKQIGTLAIGILMLAGAMAMYAGDSTIYPTNLTNPVYTVIGNESDLTGLNVSYENGNITITTVINYKPDNFTLIFFDNITREVVQTVYRGGGGGSRTRYVDKDVTVYVPEYVETVKEVEVEKVIDRIEYINDEDGFKLWHLLLAIVCGGLFVWFVIWMENKNPSAEKIMEDVNSEEKEVVDFDEIAENMRKEEG